MIKRMKWSVVGLCLGLAGTARANNLAVSSATLVSQSTWTYDVSFNISWNNSWYANGAPSLSANWDAAWVFVKFSTRTAGGSAWGPWGHATLLGSGDTIPAGAQEKYGDTGGVHKGVFLYRNAPGSGTNNWTGAALRWNFGADNVSSTTVMAVQVFAIEMVYVTTGAFSVGSGGTGTGEFYTYNTANSPYVISAAGSIPVGTTNGNLWYPGTGNQGDGTTGSTSASFPNGYGAFYIMKSEISQRQYCDFLNTLTATQSANRVDSGGHFNDGYRNWIKKAANGKYGTDANLNAGPWGSANYVLMNEAADGGWTAANYLEWADVTAYADWAALRPFTELEFEKASRGEQTPVPDEYAWGSTVIQEASGTISGAGTNAEGPSNASANCVVGNDGNAVVGPLRSGSMAGTGTTRVQAGAGYFGALDLSGNLWERPVTVGNAAGRAFDGQHGDGYLDASGNANVTNWPNNGTAIGSGLRGGSWLYDSGSARVSDRGSAADADYNRSNIYGGRCARTSP